MPLQPGQTVAHYRIENKLGEGGMGEVFTAEDTKLKRRVALKVLAEKMAADADRRTRFEREARAVAALNHPNIVTVHSVEEAETDSGPVHFITMELVTGHTLTEFIPVDGFEVNRLLEIAIPLVDAVSRAHREGITHRDLKPDNIMIDEDGRLRVLDFGLAKLNEPAGLTGDTQAATVTSDTEEGRILGTVAYMSPEQAEGKTVDARSDVFSLGIILYELATGTRPFKGDTRMSTIGAILKDEPVSITEIKGSLPRHAGRILRRCLAKDPERRYQTALDLRNELEELKAEIQSGIHTTDFSAGRRTRARGLRPFVFGAVAILAIAAVYVIFQLSRGDSATRDRSYSVVPITSGIGLELAPTWSPGGEFLAYSEVRNGSMDLVVKPMAGGDPVVRAGGPGDEANPNWSPDGEYIAYVSTSEPGTPIYLIPPHAGPKKRLIDTGFPGAGIVHLSAMGHDPWSSDGQTLLVSLASGMARASVFRVDRDNGTAEPVTRPPPGVNDHGASYSPDGKHIVFTRGGLATQYGDVMIMPAEGGEPERLIEGGSFAKFRPDGRTLLFNRSLPSQPGNLWEFDMETREETQLTHEAVHTILSFAVSSTGRIAYQSFWHDTFLYTLDLDSGERRQMTSHTKENFRGRFSPDGETIAYSSTRSGNWEIYLLPIDGGAETRITTRDGTDDFPDWSPDGTQLIYFADKAAAGNNVRVIKERQLIVVNRDGGGAKVLSDGLGFGPARWSPSGKRIAYVSLVDGLPALWTVSPEGGDATAVHPLVASFDWYLDDTRGLYTVPHGTENALLAVDLESGKTKTLFVGPFLEMDVAPDGSSVALTLGKGHISLSLAVLKLKPSTDGSGLPTPDGEPEILIRAEGTWHVHLGGWSADSKQIIYTRDQDYGDLFELVEN